jgi:hypothetical protein
LILNTSWPGDSKDGESVASCGAIEVGFRAMATTAKAKPAKQKAAEDSLESLYEELVKILKRHAPPFRTDVPLIVRDKKAFQLTAPKPVAIPGAYGGRPVDLQMAAAILQERYVGFYLMCIYLNDDTKKKLPPKLLKLLKGKTCFHLKNLDDGLRRDIEAALELGTKSYQERGWM